MKVLALPRTVYNAIRHHSEESYPRECCGTLLGFPVPEGWVVEAAIRGCETRSCDGHYTASKISETEMNKIERLAQHIGFQIAGFYHSHPNQSARWSSADLAEAHRIGCSYLITEVGHGRAATTNGFLLAGTREEDKRFEAQEIHILD